MRLLRFLPRFQQAYRELATLAARETWSRAQIDSYQLERVNALWEQSVASVPHYRRLQRQTQLPKRFDSLSEFQSAVPVLQKSSVKSDKLEFLSERAGTGFWDFTGGSTGVPMHVFWSEEAHRQNRRFGYRFYEMWGVDIFDRFAFLWGHGATVSRGLTGRLARLDTMLRDRLRNRIRMSAYDLSRETLRDYIKQITSFQPAAIYAYSMACHLLAREAEHVSFAGDSLKLITLSSEPATPRMIETIERAFHVPAVMEYGSVEAGYLAGEWPDRTLRVREDAVLMETLPRDDGRYEIVITMLGNPSFPLIRYAIGDMTDAPLERPESGFAILKNIVGRNNEFVVSRSGRFLPPVYFEETFGRRSSIRRYCINQNKDGSVATLIELADENAPVDCQSIKLELQEFVGDWPIEVAIADTIPPNRAGKHRWITSEMACARELTV